jgi:hypothetical protein
VLVIMIFALIGLSVPPLTARADESKLSFGLGLLPSPEGNYPRATLNANQSLPSAVSLGPWFPPVANQGAQASCVGWAIAYYYRSFQEGRENQRIPQRDNEIFSPAFIYNQRAGDRTRDAGMSMVDGLRIAVNQGVATLATMPYNPFDATTQPSEAARAEAALYSSSSYQNLFLGRGTANLQLLKQHLAEGDPFLLALPVYSEFFRVNPTQSLIDLPAANSTFYGGHAVLVVGYDDATQRFKFVNSWGSGWAERGYAYLSYAFVQQRAWEGWYLVDTDTTPPALAKVAYELSGAQSNMLSTLCRPTFAWEPSVQPSTSYQIYWGTNCSGTGSSMSTTRPLYAPMPVTTSGTYYLRVRALDPAGNSSPWQTLFTFRHQESAALNPATAATKGGSATVRPAEGR